MSGTTDKAKGCVKEAIGALSDDQRLKNEGKVDQATGAVKDGVAKVVLATLCLNPSSTPGVCSP